MNKSKMSNVNRNSITKMARPRRCRRGGVLLIVLGVAIIVSIIALSTLLLNRQTARRSRMLGDATQADYLAKSGLELGLHRIQNDSAWRQTYSDGVWINGAKATNGSVTIAGLDPTDGDLADDDQDPVRLISTAVTGNATRAVTATLQPTTQVFDCAHSMVHAGQSLQLINSTLFGTGRVSANGNVSVLFTSNLYADVVVAGTLLGSSKIHGTIQSASDALSMPDPAEVVSLFESMGTTIDVNSVSLTPPPAILVNGDFASGLVPWFARGGGEIEIADTGRTDLSSLKLGNRASADHGPAQDVTGKLVKNGLLNIECWVTHNEPVAAGGGASTASEPDSFGGATDSPGSPGGTVSAVGAAESVGEAEAAAITVTDSYAVFLEVITTTGTSQLQLTPWESTIGPWVHLTGSTTVSWTGTLQKAVCYVRSQTRSVPIWIDDFQIEEDTSAFKLVHRAVFSPNHNPLTGVTNPEGIYVIDCQNQSLALDRVRLVGTLVLKNVGPTCIIRGAPVSFRPAKADFPIIVADGSITIESTDDGLSESAAIANFNPTHTPFEGQSDLDILDIYRSRLEGLVYSAGSIQIRNESPVTGPIIADQNVTFSGADIKMGFHRFRENARIPGFTTQTMMLDLDSIQPSSPYLNENSTGLVPKVGEATPIDGGVEGFSPSGPGG
ncbi:MAG: carbohydrate binding domain-containing protein [Planctomycetota bacterium]